MSRLLATLRAVYDFVAGDAVILAVVSMAFAAAGIAGRRAGAVSPTLAAVFVALICAALIGSVVREVVRGERLRR